MVMDLAWAAEAGQIGEGRATHRTQGEFRFAFSDVFMFRENLIERVESYITPLGHDAGTN